MYQTKSASKTLVSIMIFFICSLNNAVYADTSVNLSGFLNSSSPSSLDIASLEAYGASHSGTVKTVSQNGVTYIGISLSSYLGSYVATDPTVSKNDVLRDVVQATGSNGSTVYSLGDLNSSFGNQNDILAYQANSSTLSSVSVIATDGADVSNLSSLTVDHVPYTSGAPGGLSSQFTISGAGLTPQSYTYTSLSAATPSVTVTASGGTYTGTELWNLLIAAGLSTSNSNLLNEYVVVTGTDNYQTAFSLEELDPTYGNEKAVIAYEQAGYNGSLGSGNGFARLVLPGDTVKRE